MSFFRASLLLACLLAVTSVHAQVQLEPEVDPPVPIIVGGAITLEEAAALALEHNPSLQVYPWDVRMAEARALQASLRPNPELAFEIEEVRLGESPTEQERTVGVAREGLAFERGETEGGPAGFREAEFTLRVSQLFLLGGKRKKAVAVALRERDIAAWDYEIARTNVLRDVARAYVTVLAAQDRVTERAQILALAESVEETIEARVEAGKVSPIQATRAAVETAAALIASEQAERLFARARVELAATWGHAVPMFDEAAGDIHSAAELPLLSALLNQVEANPDIHRWQRELARREAVLKLARARRLPDITASLGFVTQGVTGRDSQTFGAGPGGFSFSRSSGSFDDGRDNRIEFEVSIPLPIFDRNQGNIREAEYDLAKVDPQRRVTVSDIQAQLAAQYQNAMAAYDEILQLRDVALPLAEEAYNAIQIGYDEGKFGYLDVLDAQRNLFDLRIQLLEAYAAYHQATVEIGRLLGEPLWAQNDLPNPVQENANE